MLYAYRRMLGDSQAKAAIAVGRTERTGWGWENDPELWALARQEAKVRWLDDVEDSARRAVKSSVDAGNAAMGLTLLERLDPRLAPAKQKLEHTGKDGAPLPAAAPAVVFYMPENGRNQSVTAGNTPPQLPAPEEAAS